uniref:Uncharacterized protein n=1 Tax=Arundo donax TaxID=35708 RepID=A0A0A9H1L1_ARUDO
MCLRYFNFSKENSSGILIKICGGGFRTWFLVAPFIA